MTSAPPRQPKTASPARPAPICCSTRTTPCTGGPGGPRRWPRPSSTNKPILLSVGYAACHWCHVMAHESFEDAATAARHERAVRQHQGRPRGAARHRRHLHARAARAGRAGRLAADHVPRQRGAPVLGRHLLPAEPRYGRPGFRAGAARGRRASTARSATRSPTTPACWSTRSKRAREAGNGHARDRGRGARRPHAPHGQRGRSASTAGCRARRSSRSGASSGCCGAAPSATATRPPGTPSTLTLDQHLPGRHLRPPRRRLRALLGRRALARAALREDALRQRAADRPACARPTARPATELYARAHRRDGRLAAARDDRRGRRLRRLARRRLRGRGRQVLRLEQAPRSIEVLGEADAGCSREAYDVTRRRQLGRPHHPQPPAQSALRSPTDEKALGAHARASCWRAARAASAPAGTTRCWPTGTA